MLVANFSEVYRGFYLCLRENILFENFESIFKLTSEFYKSVLNEIFCNLAPCFISSLIKNVLPKRSYRTGKRGSFSTTE